MFLQSLCKCLLDEEVVIARKAGDILTKVRYSSLKKKIRVNGWTNSSDHLSECFLLHMHIKICVVSTYATWYSYVLLVVPTCILLLNNDSSLWGLLKLESTTTFCVIWAIYSPTSQSTLRELYTWCLCVACIHNVSTRNSILCVHMEGGLFSRYHDR